MVLDNITDVCYTVYDGGRYGGTKRKEMTLRFGSDKTKSEMINMAAEGLLRFYKKDGSLVHPENVTLENIKDYEVEMTDAGWQRKRELEQEKSDGDIN